MMTMSIRLYFDIRVSFAPTTQHCTTERSTRYASYLPYRPPYHPFPVYGLIVDRACRSKPLRLNVRLKIGECSGPPEPARLLLLPIFCLSGEPWPHGCATTTRSRHVIGIHKAGEGRMVVVSEGIGGVGGEGGISKSTCCGVVAKLTRFSKTWKNVRIVSLDHTASDHS